ncbi:MAG: hypothetical protein HYY52_03455 [Candidatus Melainabacteria bacterium]|nr:hypothetical protein [Candidatus Melainabacteria bacterium]
MSPRVEGQSWLSSLLYSRPGAIAIRPQKIIEMLFPGRNKDNIQTIQTPSSSTVSFMPATIPYVENIQSAPQSQQEILIALKHTAKNLLKVRRHGLFADLHYNADLLKRFAEPETNKLSQELSETLTTYCLSNIGFIDSNDFNKGNTKIEYSFHLEINDEDGKILKEELRRGVIITELFRNNKQLDLDKYLKVFNEKLSFAARLLYRDILFSLLMQVDQEKLQAAINELKSPVEGTYNDISAELKNLNPEHVDEYLRLLRGEQAEFLLKLNAYRESNTLQDPHNSSINTIATTIETSPKEFKETLLTLNRIVDLEGLGALDRPNRLSAILDKIQNDVRDLHKKASKSNSQQSFLALSDTGEYVDSEKEQANISLIERPYRTVLLACTIAYENEKKIINDFRRQKEEQDLQGRRDFGKKAAVVAGAATVIGSGGYFLTRLLSSNLDLRVQRIEKLKSDIDAYTKLDFDEFSKRAAVELEELKKKKEADPYEIYLNVLCAYLERKPSEGELREEIEYFLQNFDELTKRRKARDPKPSKAILEKYCNKLITSNQMADEIQELHFSKMDAIPHILASLLCVRAIEKRDVEGVPGDLLEKGVTNNLRNLFKDDEWSTLYRLEDKTAAIGRPVYKQITPTMGVLIGTRICKKGGGGGSLASLIEHHRKQTPLLPIYDNSYIARVKVQCTKMRRAVDAYKEALIARYESSNEIKELKALQNKIDITEDLSGIEININEIINVLNKKKEDLAATMLGIERCLVRLHEIETMASKTEAIRKIQAKSAQGKQAN